MAVVSHLEFSKFLIFYIRPSVVSDFVYWNKISWKSVNPLLSYGQNQFSSIPSVAILNVKFKFGHRTFVIFLIYIGVQNSSKSDDLTEIWHCNISRGRSSAILDFQILHSTVITPDLASLYKSFVKIAQAAAELWPKTVFQYGVRPPSWI